MVIWINGAFGAGKTTVAAELCRRLPGAFCYDPENAGYFLRQNTPACLHTPDFQDMPLWRQINGLLLAQIAREYPGDIVIPMTLVSRRYWQQIAGELEKQGVRVEHVILWADRETIVRRLSKRSLGMLWREQFALDALDRCLTAFSQAPAQRRIRTEGKTPGQLAQQIADLCGLELDKDSRSALGKSWGRLKTWVSHIRF